MTARSLAIMPSEVAGLAPAVFRLTDLTSDEKNLLTHLVWFWLRNQPVQSRAYLGSCIGRKPRSVCRLISQLLKKGQITVDRRSGEMNVYGPGPGKEGLWKQFGLSIADSPPANQGLRLADAPAADENYNSTPAHVLARVPAHDLARPPAHGGPPTTPIKNKFSKTEKERKPGWRRFDPFRPWFNADRRKPEIRLKDAVERGNKNGRDFFVQSKRRDPRRLLRVSLSSDAKTMFFILQSKDRNCEAAETFAISPLWMHRFEFTYYESEQAVQS